MIFHLSQLGQQLDTSYFSFYTTQLQLVRLLGPREKPAILNPPPSFFFFILII